MNFHAASRMASSMLRRSMGRVSIVSNGPITTEPVPEAVVDASRSPATEYSVMPYSIVAVLESGRSSWTAPLDAVRLVPGQDATEVTATQIQQVWQRLRAAGQWREGDPPVLVVLDAGYDVIRLAFLLHDLPVRLLGRVRADRVFHAPAQPYAGTGAEDAWRE